MATCRAPAPEAQTFDTRARLDTQCDPRGRKAPGITDAPSATRAVRWALRVGVAGVVGLLACRPIPHAAVGPSARPARNASNRVACAGLQVDDAPDAARALAARQLDVRSRAADAEHAIVVTNDERSASASLSVLRAGGDAADAFVAAAAVETVVFPGVTSLAGFSSLLYFDAATRHATYVAGSHGAPRDPAGAYRTRNDPVGRTAAIPGAAFGLAEAVRGWGRRTLAQDLAPAVALARNGFEVDDIYHSVVARFRGVLERSEYGRATYLPVGQPPAVGSTLRLPIYGTTLEQFAQIGSAYFARGAWAAAFVQMVNAAGGRVSLDDLADRTAGVFPATQWSHAGVDLLFANGPSRGGAAMMMVAWSLFDAVGGGARRPFSREWLEAQLWAFVGTSIESPWIRSSTLPQGDPDLANEAVTRARAVHAMLTRAMGLPNAGAPGHSSAIVVVDADGNIAVGMHTINSLPFGEGIFVEGVPLSAALEYEEVPPGEPVIQPVSPVIVLVGGVPRLALAQFGVGEFPSDFAVLSSVLGAGIDVVDAVDGPRLGYFDVGADAGSVTSSHLMPIAVDPRYAHDDLCALASRGWPLDARAASYRAHVGYVDIVAITPGAGPHTLRGVPAALLNGRAIGY